MSRYRRYAIGLLLMWPAALGDARAQSARVADVLGYPDLIVHSAKIVTVDDHSFSEGLGTIAEAMAIREGRILAIGSTSDIKELQGPKTRVVDLAGRTVVPGMVLVHNHPQDWIRVVPEIMHKVVPEDIVVSRFLKGTPKEQIERFPSVLAEAVAVVKPGAWIRIVFAWDATVDPEDPYVEWPGTMIRKEQLDQAAPNNPILVEGRPAILRQNHKVMVNQKAIEIIRRDGLADDLAELNNLEYEEKTGIASEPLTYRLADHEVIYKGRLDILAEALRLDMSWWAGLGQTTVATLLYNHPSLIKALRYLDKRGLLDNRFAWGWGNGAKVAWERMAHEPFLIADLATRLGEGTDYFWYYGTGESGGPCVSMSPLASRPKGKLILPSATNGCRAAYERGGIVWNALYNIVREGGRLIGYHNFGDVDIDNKISLVEEASREAGFTPDEIRSKRHVAGDHMQGWPRPDQIPRMAALGMVVGGTNFYIHQDSVRWLRDYGEKALDMVVPRKALFEGGVMNGIEVDKPIEIAGVNSIFAPLYWSIGRKGQDGRTYAPHQRLSRQQALKTATIFGAYYVLREKLIGSLERGKFADFIVLDRDYLTIPEDDIPKIRIMMTAVGGRIVHLVPSLAEELGMAPAGAMVELGVAKTF